METVRPRSFDSSSPVLAYWLAHAEGFEVRAGRRTGVVEEVRHGSAGLATHLVVRFGRRERVVPASAVGAVVPDEELLVLRGPRAEPRPSTPPRLAPAARRAATTGGQGMQAAASGSRRVATASWRATDRGGRVMWAGASRASAESWSAARRFGRWIRPRAAAAWSRLVEAVLAILAWLATTTRTLVAWVRMNAPPAARALRAGLAVQGDGRDRDTFPAPPVRADQEPEPGRTERHAA